MCIIRNVLTHANIRYGNILVLIKFFSDIFLSDKNNLISSILIQANY